MNVVNSTAALIASITALVAVLGGIIAQTVTVWRKTDEPGKDAERAVRLKKTLRRMANLSTALLVVVSLGAVIILLARTPPQCRPVTLTITSPGAGATVNQSQTVTGELTCLSAGQHAWLILQPGGAGGGGYFPADEVSVAGDTWSTTAYFGQPSSADDGRPFTVLAVIANDTADQRFRNWLDNGKATRRYPALLDLTGATVMTQFEVSRDTYRGP